MTQGASAVQTKVDALHDISPETLLAAARERYGADADVSFPYWIGPDFIRLGVTLNGGNISFGANFNFKEGKFY